MKLNDFLNKMAEQSLAIKNWVESEAMDEGLYVYFKDDEDLFFVFILMTGPVYLGALNKILKLPFVKDVGISPTFNNDGKVFEKSYDIVVKLNEGIEDLDLNDDECHCCNCESECEGCDDEECEDGECECGNKGCGKKIWN